MRKDTSIIDIGLCRARSEYGLISFANAPGSGSRLARATRAKKPPHKSFVRCFFCGLDAEVGACHRRRQWGKLFFSGFIDAIGIIHLFKPCCVLFHAFSLLFHLNFMVIITSLKVATCLNASVIVSVTEHVENTFY